MLWKTESYIFISEGDPNKVVVGTPWFGFGEQQMVQGLVSALGMLVFLLF